MNLLKLLFCKHSYKGTFFTDNKRILFVLECVKCPKVEIKQIDSIEGMEWNIDKGKGYYDNSTVRTSH